MNLPSCPMCPMCQSENYSDSKPLNATYTAKLPLCWHITMAFAQVQATFILNNQGTQNLSFNGYLYRMKNNNGERIYWRCTVKDCHATTNTRNNIPTGFGRKPHNHPSNHAKIDAKQIINTIRNRAIEQNPKLSHYPNYTMKLYVNSEPRTGTMTLKTQLNNYQHFLL